VRTPDIERERWNRRYTTGDRIHPTTAPSAFLVTEVAHLAPAAALDLACGTGRHAVWLAQRGWSVTAVDFSEIALTMARGLAVAGRVDVEWIEADVVDWLPPPLAFDLVCMLYVQLPASDRRAALRHAVSAVRPGGTLLVLGHDVLNLAEGWGGPSKREVLFTPDDIVKEIEGLEVEKAERVRRRVEEGGVVSEAIDALVRARRPAPA